MIELPTEKKWSGDGWNTDPRLMFQVKRSPKNAIYRVTSFKTGKTTGYEVFKIRITPKGTQVFDKVTEDDEEKYPTAEQFGKTAWATDQLDRAEYIFNRLEQGMSPYDEEIVESEESAPVVKAEPAPEKKRQHYVGVDLTFPPGEFSVDELANHNQVQYAKAYLFLRDGEEKGLVRFVKKEHRNGSRKPTKIFAKVS